MAPRRCAYSRGDGKARTLAGGSTVSASRHPPEHLTCPFSGVWGVPQVQSHPQVQSPMSEPHLMRPFSGVWGVPRFQVTPRFKTDSPNTSCAPLAGSGVPPGSKSPQVPSQTPSPNASYPPLAGSGVPPGSKPPPQVPSQTPSPNASCAPLAGSGVSPGSK